MTDRAKALLKSAGGLRYALLAAAAGLVLLLWPTGRAQDTSGGEDTEETRLETLLSAMEGVGRSEVLLSENGAAVVCQGADSVSVRLAVTETMRCYTGLGADRIVIYKMNESWREKS